MQTVAVKRGNDKLCAPFLQLEGPVPKCEKAGGGCAPGKGSTELDSKFLVTVKQNST